MKMNKSVKGGFRTEREFGFQLAERFPGLDLTKVDTEGVALIVDIANPRYLNLYQLSKALLSAAKGGLKTAVIHHRARGIAEAIPLFTLWALVDENSDLKEQLRLEAAVRTAA
ncbi:hypothetical protein [Streptomyces sp. NPDC059874]|uniref:hypothetical protein n=1 Tax=Streptomyces sp. NPDC059874 TaxID=3346983 RepID=UPI003647A314